MILIEIIQTTDSTTRFSVNLQLRKTLQKSKVLNIRKKPFNIYFFENIYLNQYRDLHFLYREYVGE